MAWGIAGGGVVLVALVTGFVIWQRRGIAMGDSRRDPAQVWLQGDPGAPGALAPGRDDPGAGGGSDSGHGGDDGGGDTGSGD